MHTSTGSLTQVIQQVTNRLARETGGPMPRQGPRQFLGRVSEFGLFSRSYCVVNNAEFSCVGMLEARCGDQEWPSAAQRLGNCRFIGRKNIQHRNGLKNVQGKPEGMVLV